MRQSIERLSAHNVVRYVVLGVLAVLLLTFLIRTATT
jgi:hypothetical protein